MHKKTKKISVVFRKWLTIIVVTAFALSLLFSWIYQTKKVRDNAASLLRINIDDVRQDTIDASDKNLLDLTREIAGVLDRQEGDITSEDLAPLPAEYDIPEIDVISPDGIITASTVPSFVNFDMRSGAQSAEFLVLLDGKTDSYVQSYQPIAWDSSLSRKYGGVVLKRGGFVQVGYDAERFQRDIDEHIAGVTRNRHVGENGCVIAANENWLIVSDRNRNEGKNLEVTGIWIDRETMQPETVYTASVYGKESYFMYAFSEGYYIISVIPMDELLLSRNASVMMTAAMDILIFLALFILIVTLVRRLVVNNIDSVNGSLSRITGGDLGVQVDVRNSEEFSSLSDDINSTVTTLKKYIADAAARIDQELEFARVIQLSAMPRVFPEQAEYEIHASIVPAKEVGGDFYDFFTVDDDHLALVIADVSGHGIPAAMFMMTAKTLIKNRARLGESPEEILGYVNNQLCEGNEGELFVTVWMAIIEISTGKGVAVNAGHEHPALRRAGGMFELVKYRHSPAVALEEDIRFRQHEFELHPGDSLFVYTDGVAEAHDAANGLYGTDRMLAVLNRDPEAPPKALLESVMADINDFEEKTPQFDDITMIGFRYHGPERDNPAEVTVDATIENMPQVMQVVNRRLKAVGCPLKTARQIGIAVEELYVNIASYAYSPESGTVSVRADVRGQPPLAEITFTDSGRPYNPLAKPDPDTSLSIRQRQKGGLGIYMVKQSMNQVNYENRDGKNILTIGKILGEDG